jgi:hypothetical protein
MPKRELLHNDFIADVQLRKLHTVTFTLMPQNWENYIQQVDLRWKVVRFTEANLRKIPDDCGGVYTFVIVPNVAKHPKCTYLVYVGETHEFRQRYQKYLRDRTDPKARALVKCMLSLWDGYLWYCYAKIEETGLIHTVQDNLIRALDPVVNRMFPVDVQATITGASL